MTHDEYKNLLKEWNESDSASRRHEIECEVLKAAEGLLHSLSVMYRDNVGRRYVASSDYKEEEGTLAVMFKRCGEDYCSLEYNRPLSEDGSEVAVVPIGLPMKYLDKQIIERLKTELMLKKVEIFSNYLVNLEKSRIRIEAEIKRYKAELERLEEELTDD